jgi:hypothetical protein
MQYLHFKIDKKKLKFDKSDLYEFHYMNQYYFHNNYLFENIGEKYFKEKIDKLCIRIKYMIIG